MESRRKGIFSMLMLVVLLFSFFAVFGVNVYDIEGESFGATELVPIVDTFTTVTESNTTAWDTVDINSPYVLYDADASLYKMWYHAKSEPTQIGPWVTYREVISYAESNDGLTWFNKQVVHDNGGPSSNYYETGDPFVLKENGTYRMWHFDRWEWVMWDWSRYIARMSSSDGVNWPAFMSPGDQKVLSALGQTNPQGDGNSVFSPSIIYEPGAGYVMWYSVGDYYGPGSYGPSKIWWTTSNDGIAWSNRQLSLPYIPDTWESDVRHASVIKEDDGTYTMFYGASYANGSAYIGIAESLDGMSWTNRTRFLKPSDLGANITWIGQPFHFQDLDGRRYLYFAYNDGKAKFGRILLDSPPEPYITYPANNDYLFGDAPIVYGDSVQIWAVEMNLRQDIAYALFEYSIDGGNWTTIGTDYNGSLVGVWNAEWNTTGFQEGLYYVRVKMEDDYGLLDFNQKEVYYDPMPPLPTIQRTDWLEINSTYTFNVTTEAQDIVSLRLEYYNATTPYKRLDGVGNLNQSIVGPGDMGCVPTATANALMSLARKDREILKVPTEKLEQKYDLWFAEHKEEMKKKFPNLKDEDYWTGPPNKKYLTNLGLAVVLRKYMWTTAARGTDDSGECNGIGDYLLEHQLDGKYKYSGFSVTTKELEGKDGDKGKRGDNIMVADDGFGHQKSVQRWNATIKDWGRVERIYYANTRKPDWNYDKNEDKNTISERGYFHSLIDRHEAVIVGIFEMSSGHDGIMGTDDDVQEQIRWHELTVLSSFHESKQDIGPERLTQVWGFMDPWTGSTFCSLVTYREGWFRIAPGPDGVWGNNDDIMQYKAFNQIEYQGLGTGHGKYWKVGQISSVSPIEKGAFLHIDEDWDQSNGLQVAWNTTTQVPDGVYSIRVVMNDTTGNTGVDYAIVHVNNQPITPVTLYTPQYTDITSHSVTLSWTPNQDYDFVSYQIYVSTSPETLGTLAQEIAYNASQTTTTIENLTANTTYYFTVRTVDVEGEYADSNKVSATTKLIPPDVAITNLIATTSTVTVTVENQGDDTATTTITVTYILMIDPLIGTQTITLPSGATTILVFTWSPEGYGTYEITAVASIIPGEVDTADNTRTIGFSTYGYRYEFEGRYSKYVQAHMAIYGVDTI